MANWQTGYGVGAAVNVRCVYCGDRIGVYEPMIRLNGSLATPTSRAAEPRFDATGGSAAFHAECYREHLRASGPQG